MLSRKVAQPLYVQIANEIRSSIRSGKYPPGSLIPSESALSAKYNVGRITTRQALKVLSDENLIVKKQGLGTFVSDEPIDQELSSLKTITEVLMSKGIKPKIKVVSYQIEKVARRITKELEIPEDENVIAIKRLYLVKRSPLSLVSIYLPTKYEHIAKSLKKASPATNTTYSLFEDAGINPDMARHSIKAKEADSETAQCFNIHPGTPILCLERTTYLSDGTPLEHIVFHYRADRFEFKLKVPRIKSTVENQYDELAGGIAHVLNPNFQSEV